MKTATLGEIADWGSGGTPKRGVAEYFGEGTPWLSIADLNDGVVTSAKESLTPAGIQNSSAKIVPPGTLFVAMYGSIGKLGIAGSEMATSQAIAFAKPKDDLVDRRFLFHFLLTERPMLQALGRGGTQMNIGQADLKRWPISLPSLSEQRRIAAILDHADALRTKRRQVLAHLDVLTQSIFNDMFEGAIKGAERVQLQSLAALITKGTTPTSVGLQFTSQGVPFVRVQNLQQGTVRFDSGALFISAEAHKTLRRSIIRPEDLLISIAGTIGRIAIVPRDAAEMNCNQAVAIVRPADPAMGPWLMAWLTSRDAKGQIGSSAVTATIANLSLGQIGRLDVPVVGVAATQQFARRSDAVNAQRTAVLAAERADDELFASLQSRAFRGEL